MKLQPCDIVLVKNETSWISEEIEEVTKSIYSHSAIIIKENTLIEAGTFDVRYNALDSYNGHYDVYRCPFLDSFDKAQIVNYLVKQIGKKYDYKLLIYEWVRYRLNIILPFWFKNSDSVICSELVKDSFLNTIGINLTPGIQYPSPKDISESKLLTKIEI